MLYSYRVEQKLFIITVLKQDLWNLEVLIKYFSKTIVNCGSLNICTIPVPLCEKSIPLNKL